MAVDVLKAFTGEVQSVRVVQLSEVDDVTSSLKWKIPGHGEQRAACHLVCFCGRSELNKLVDFLTVTLDLQGMQMVQSAV